MNRIGGLAEQDVAWDSAETVGMLHKPRRL